VRQMKPRTSATHPLQIAHVDVAGTWVGGCEATDWARRKPDGGTQARAGCSAWCRRDPRAGGVCTGDGRL